MEIATSILSVDKENAIQIFYNIEVAKTNYFHIDVMDGKFVKNNTTDFMHESAQTIKQISNVPLDVHLMVNDAEKYINDYVPLEPAYITVHYESFKNNVELMNAINNIKSEGIKSGISIKPSTDWKQIIDFLPYINLIQVMTVEPGEGGQKLLTETLKKIEDLNEYREKNNLDFFIEADGGIKTENSILVKNAGADIAVAGTAIVQSKYMKKTIEALR
jgi:ribulose-phosphate 3-epimerase